MGNQGFPMKASEAKRNPPEPGYARREARNARDWETTATGPLARHQPSRTARRGHMGNQGFPMKRAKRSGTPRRRGDPTPGVLAIPARYPRRKLRTGLVPAK